MQISSSSESTMKKRKNVDMSDEAIARRLEELGALYRLSVSLLGARRIGRIEDQESTRDGNRKDERPESEPASS